MYLITIGYSKLLLLLFSFTPLLSWGAPNIIFIYADDLGMGMLGCYGQDIVKTPNIDRLADQGTVFTRVYSSQYCCPARASLLMGVHDSHSNSYAQTPGGLVNAMEKTSGHRNNLRRKLKPLLPSNHRPEKSSFPSDCNMQATSQKSYNFNSTTLRSSFGARLFVRNTQLWQ